MCTEFILPSQLSPQLKDFPFSGRTMDFEYNFDWTVAAIPEETKLHAVGSQDLPLAKKLPGYKWVSKYAYIGVGISAGKNVLGKVFDSVLDLPSKVSDGLNTEGLTAAALWLPGSEYPHLDNVPSDDYSLLSMMDICCWALSQYKNIPDLKADLEKIRQGKPIKDGTKLYIWDPLQFNANSTVNLMPLHFQFHDRQGNSLLLEFRNGKLEITDNTDLGVLTNAPFYDWHRTNLQNYLNITNIEPNKEGKSIIGMHVKAAGNGSGTIGLSSSPLPADRFLRTVQSLNFGIDWLKDNSQFPKKLLAYAINIIAGVVVAPGVCKTNQSEATGDYTQWWVVRDPIAKELHIATYDSLGTWTVRFKDFKLNSGSKPVYLDLNAATEMPTLKP